MKTSARRWLLPTAPALLALALSTSTVPAASAENWHAADVAGDVSAATFSLEPLPCGTFTRVADPEDVTTDLVEISARHRRDTVELSARFRDLTAWGERFVTFDVRTDRREFEVAVVRHRRHGGLEVQVMRKAAPPTDTGECNSYITVQVVKTCTDAGARMSPTTDAVTVVIPRECLDSPRWIQAGVNVARSTGQSSSSFDRWDPAGVEQSAYAGPFGPRRFWK